MIRGFLRNLKQIIGEIYLAYLKCFNPDYGYISDAPTSTNSKNNDTNFDQSGLTRALELQLQSFRFKMMKINEIIGHLSNSLNEIRLENLTINENVTAQVIQELMYNRQLKYVSTKPIKFKFTHLDGSVKIEGTFSDIKDDEEASIFSEVSSNGDVVGDGDKEMIALLTEENEFN